MLSKECLLCHRIGAKGFVPMHSEGWCCSNDRACKRRADARVEPAPTNIRATLAASRKDTR